MSSGMLPVLVSGRPRRGPPRDQPISVPTRLTGPQWMNMPKRKSFQCSMAGLGAPGSPMAGPVWVQAGRPASKGSEQKVRRFIGHAAELGENVLAEADALGDFGQQ